MTALSERIEADDRARLRRRLLDRGADIAGKLAKLMAGGDGDAIVRALGLAGKPGARPEEILRRSLDHVDGLRRWIDADDDRYGRCHACGVALPVVGLLEVPWADGCPAHAT